MRAILGWEKGDKGLGRMTIFTTNEWPRTAPDRAIAALYMAALFVYEGLVWIQTLLIVKKVVPILPPTMVSLAFGRLSGLALGEVLLVKGG
jgi:hypothetical protein